MLVLKLDPSRIYPIFSHKLLLRKQMHGKCTKLFASSSQPTLSSYLNQSHFYSLDVVVDLTVGSFL